MRHFFPALLVSVVAALPARGATDPYQLLIPLGQAEAHRVFRQNSYEIRKAAYFARRYRIVRVDTSQLLDGAVDIDLALFDDLSVPVRTENFSMGPDGYGFHWQGLYASVPTTRNDFAAANPQNSRRLSDAIYARFFEVHIRGAQYVYEQDPSAAEALSGLRWNPTAGRITRESDRLSGKLARGKTLFGIRADLNIAPVLAARGQYTDTFSVTVQIRPVDGDRRYALVLEIDPDKTYTLPGDSGVLPRDVAEKARRHKEFLKSLGPPPASAFRPAK